MNADALLRSVSETQVAAFILVLGRLAPLFILAPLFSSRLIPGRVRTVIAVGLAVGLGPIAIGKAEVPMEIGPFTELMLKEILVGLAFAFALGALFAAVNVAGTFLDTMIGFSYGALVDPVTGAQSAVLSQTYSLVGVLVLIAIGGDQMIIRGLGRSYEIVPLLAMPSLPQMIAGAQDAFVGVFLAALELSAPIVLALIITDCAFGMVAKVVPQLNVFAVGFPAKVAVGLLMIAASLPFAAGWMADELEASVTTALQSLQVEA